MYIQHIDLFESVIHLRNKNTHQWTECCSGSSSVITDGLSSNVPLLGTNHWKKC